MTLPAHTIPDMNRVVGSHDILFITLDTLRYDIAQQLYEAGELPVLGRYLPTGGWERRHTPATFTYAAHHAFFAGFLPTPDRPGPHPRLFATAFRGSESTSAHTCLFEQESIPAGLAAAGYHTVCIGGVGFFNKRTALGCVLPAMFAESHWQHAMGVDAPNSTANQAALAQQCLQDAGNQRVMLFLNVAAIHQPNRVYLRGCKTDNLDSHAAALRYVDKALGPLLATCAARAPTFVIICSDHGSAYGEAGYHGHRLAHETVWNVPYAHFFLHPPGATPP